uniref:Uncharacterized protein n=1 Tax=Arundo donax TaxID=35708 RepID=A0A0A8ZQL8_ARUDO
MERGESTSLLGCQPSFPAQQVSPLHPKGPFPS